MKKDVFINNRKKLINGLDDNSVVILFAGKAPQKSADEQYLFTPNRNFYYLTGIGEEKHILMIKKINNNVEELLFIQKPDPVMEKWVGKTIREKEAREISGIENVKYLEEFKGQLNIMFTSGEVENIYLDLERRGYDEVKSEREVFASEVVKKYPYVKVKNVYNDIAELRIIKSPEEIEEIKKAISITIEAVEVLMKNSQPGMMEYELEAYYDFMCKKKGVKDLAFKTIAAAGKNATILHYVDNNSQMKDGDLILFDLGAQVNYYNADISRTFPVNGKFSERQREVYEAVLKVNEEVISMIKPGVNWGEINEKATDLLAEECIKLGLIKEKSEVRKYYFHSIGHSLGLDTHDVGKRWVELKPGMVFTVEPGLYIEEESIGIRIEDDVLVTDTGCEVLTKDMIKSVEDIEAFMSKR
jgi:Xaa-Pro aminopeptidase